MGLVFIGYILVVEYNAPLIVAEEPSLVEREIPTEPATIPDAASAPDEPAPVRYPVDKFIVVNERTSYVDGDMRLIIPRLELDAVIYNGVDDATLKKGVGLFDYSQLPGPMGQNSNVCLAGHRDIYGNEFYYIDTITDGDEIILVYGGRTYTYAYETTFVTDPYDWNPIRVKDYGCVTLQSCEPIGVANQRIFVVGRLVNVTPIGGEEGPLEGDVSILEDEGPLEGDVSVGDDDGPLEGEVSVGDNDGPLEGDVSVGDSESSSAGNASSEASGSSAASSSAGDSQSASLPGEGGEPRRDLPVGEVEIDESEESSGSSSGGLPSADPKAVGI